MAEWTGEVKTKTAEGGGEVPTLLLDDGREIELRPNGVSTSFVGVVVPWSAILEALAHQGGIEA
jgi:hypothetical protein